VILKGLRVVLFAVALLISMIPAAHAVGCSLQIFAVDYPPIVEPGQSFQVTTQMNVTCSQSKAYIVGRLDVVETAPNVILSSTSFPIGYFADLAGGTRNVTAVNKVVAPPLQANWTLQVSATLFTSVSAIGGSQKGPFTIMVGHAPLPERLQTASILNNGDFENGLDGWSVEKSYGYLTITNKVAHSGSSALKLQMPPRHFGTIDGAMVVGVSQTISVADLRSLRVRAWVMDGCYAPWYVSCSLLGSGRLRVQVGGFTETYDFGGCSSWCQIDHNVTEDLKPRLTLAQYASILHSDRAVPVTISLELLNAGSYFVAHLDDVQVSASVPLGSTPFLSQSFHGVGMSNQGVPEVNANVVAASSRGLLWFRSLSEEHIVKLMENGFLAKQLPLESFN